jgi:hypothetical protein
MPDISWLQVIVAFALGVLLSVTVKAAVASARSKVSGG